MKYLKPFFDKAKPILDIISKESVRKNKYAQKTAKELQDFYNLTEALYLENVQLKMQIKERDAIIKAQLTEGRETDIMKERELIKDLYHKYKDRAELKAQILELANLNVESLKYLKHGK
jgi:hypothetical protein